MRRTKATCSVCGGPMGVCGHERIKTQAEIEAMLHPALWCDCVKCGVRFDGAGTIAFAVSKHRPPGWRPKVCPVCVLAVIESWPALPVGERAPGCRCTWEYGDSECPVHPTCSRCGVVQVDCECPDGCAKLGAQP